MPNPFAAPGISAQSVSWNSAGITEIASVPNTSHRGHRHHDLLARALTTGSAAITAAAPRIEALPAPDQHRRLALQAQPARADEAGQCEGRAQYHRVDGDTSYADMVNVLHGEPQAVQHHAQAKRVLLGEVDAGAAGYRPARGPG